MDDDVHYSDYISISESFRANMTREAINESPETWMDFYPHEHFLRVLDKLLETIDGGTKSIWIVGNYGTGKSNAALVIQKLFSDDLSRVERWFETNTGCFSDTYESIQDRLLLKREEGTLVVYDYNAGGLGPDEELLVRLEKSIIATLKEAGMRVPSGSPLDCITDRIREEGDRFFETRDKVSDQIRHIPPNINTPEDLITCLKSLNSESLESIKLIEDVETILRARDIYLNVSVKSLKAWIKEVQKANGIRRIIYIFDEFSDFIESNKTTLKTFEDISETPDDSGFYFIPVTHIGLNAFYSENSDSASKSKNRFDFVNLKMSENIAFELMARAISKGVKKGKEQAWEGVKDDLWAIIKDVADYFDSKHIPGFRETMRDILPIHPMTGHMLKALSECIGANQRSIFEYLKDTSRGSTFTSFLKEGGPLISGKAVLTVDYLWDYFVMRDDLGTPQEVTEVRIYYERFKNSPRFRNEPDDSQTIRVFKSILLFILHSRLAKDGNTLLQPTVENLKLAYLKDSSIGLIKTYLDDLEKASCISVLDNRIELFSSSASETDLSDQIEKYQNKFDLVFDCTKKKIEDQIKNYRYPKSRFHVHVKDEAGTKPAYFNQNMRDLYVAGGSKDNGAICLWFVISRDHQSGLLAGDSIRKTLESVKECRVLFFSFRDVTFCSTNEAEWTEYVRAVAYRDLAPSQSAKDIWSQQIDSKEKNWQQKLASAKIEAYYWDDGIQSEILGWNELSDFLGLRLHQHLEFNVDRIIDVPVSCLSESKFAKLARAGLTFDSTSSEEKRIVDMFVRRGISSDPDWFSRNPDHPLSKIHKLIFDILSSSLKDGSRFDLSKAYRKLRKSPYGLQDVAFTGFVMGFCMKELADDSYQWTDEKTTGVLDVKTLAEIIDHVIKENDARPSSGKKYICSLSEEDRRFFSDAPKMFGSGDSGSNLESTIQIIEDCCTEKSGKVPLWVIPDYIKHVGDVDAEKISDALAKVFVVLSTSSKGKTEDRSKAVREVGKMLIEDPGLPSKVSKYIDKETVNEAFRHYLEVNYPSLVEKAADVDDINCNYVDSVCRKMAPVASYLWKECDLRETVSEVALQYDVIGMVKQLTSQDHFISYEDSVKSLSTHVNGSKLPRSIIVSAYPQLDALKSRIDQLGTPLQAAVLKEVVSYLSQNLETVRKLFFNADLCEVVSIVKNRMPTDGLSDGDIGAVVRSMGPSFEKPEQDYIREFEKSADEMRENSLKKKLSDLWSQKTSTESVDDWESQYSIPGRYAFPNPEMKDVFEVILNPDSYSSMKLESAIKTLNDQQPPDIESCCDAFMEAAIPARYRKLQIQFTSLVEFLKDEYGNPGNWAVQPDISGLVHRTYHSGISPIASDRIRKTDSDEFKRMILEAIENNEDLGIEIMQVIG